MTTPNIKALAVTLHANLSRRAINLRHTNCLELICASYGLRSRNVVITTQTALSPVPSNLLAEKANRILSGKPNWIEPCIEETILLTHPTPTITLSKQGIPLDPERLAESQYYTDMIKSITSDMFYEAYPSSRAEFDQKTLNSYFKSALQTLENTGYASDGLEEAIEPERVFDEETSDCANASFEKIIDSLVSDNEEHAVAAYWSKKDEVKETITDSVIEQLNNQDTSSPTDIFSSQDRAELIIVLGNNPKYYWDDSYIYQDQDGNLTPNTALTDAMRILGLDIETYENLTSETPASDSTAPMRPTPLLSNDDFQTIIDDIGTWAFNLIIYAAIPMKQIRQLDNAKAITLDNCIVAAYDGQNGRLSEHVISSPTIINLDETVRLYTGTDFSYSPLNLSGFVPKTYKADIQAAWPYGTPLPISPEAQSIANELMSIDPETETYTETGLALINAIASACNQADTFTASANTPALPGETDFALTTAKIDKETGMIVNRPITPSLAQWLDKAPKTHRFPSRGSGSTHLNETNILARTGLRELAKAIISTPSANAKG